MWASWAAQHTTVCLIISKPVTVTIADGINLAHRKLSKFIVQTMPSEDFLLAAL